MRLRFSLLVPGLCLGVLGVCASVRACPVGDLNGDCKVDWRDLELFAGQWLDLGCAGAGCADFDGGGSVEGKDFAILASDWPGGGGTITVVINEFMAKNDGAFTDEHGDDDDWIELYNYGDSPVDVGGLYLTDRLTEPLMWPVPSDEPEVTTIEPGGYLVIWADDEPSEGPLHASFKLGADGEQVGLFHPGGQDIDSITFGPQQGDVSYGRSSDGAGTWETFASPTPGSSNQGEVPRVVITEIMYHPYHADNEPEPTGEEYIELYNAGTRAVNLAGWQFTDGVYFTFGQVGIEPGAYVAVVADVNAFAAKYPGVENFTGGWTSRLNNSGERVELVDASGLRMDVVHYCDQGDWAQRELGGDDHGHRGWVWSDAHDGGRKSLELICLGLSNEYGQNWTASLSDGGSPGAVNTRASADAAPFILDVEHWPLIPASDEAVTVTARIPSAMRSAATMHLHYRVDASKYVGADVLPHYEAESYAVVEMLDDGGHSDGEADDGVYGAVITPQANRSVVEFFVEAAGAGSLKRTWPAPSMVDGAAEQVTNVLYQVDSAFTGDHYWEPGSQSVYYIVMTEAERGELEDIGDGGDPFFGEGASDAQMNATFISIDGADLEVRYRVGVRNRGNRTRVDPPNNYRINFVNDDPWKDVTALNINSKYPHLQLMGSALFQMAGIPAPDAIAVQVRVNGDNLAAGDYSRTYGSYVALEVYDSDWAKRHFPEDDDGNAYRCTYAKPPGGGTTYADLYYKQDPGQMPEPADYLENYPKRTNNAKYDYSDLFELIDTLNNDEISDANFLSQVGQVANLHMWMRYMSADALAGNREGGLYEGEGDDYAMYRGVEDPRFRLLPHDLDTLLGQGDHSYGPDWEIEGYSRVRGLRRLFDQDAIWMSYYGQYRELAETLFRPEVFNPLVDQLLGDWVSQSEIEGSRGIKQFLADRLKSVLYGGYPTAGDEPMIPQEFSIEGPAEANGYPATNQPVAALSGRADATATASVAVGGMIVDQWSQEDGTWSIGGVPLNPGINRIFVDTHDEPNAAGSRIERHTMDIWYDDGDVADIAGMPVQDTVLDAASGPWRVSGSMVVPEGATLTIEAGATLYFERSAQLDVRGRLVAEGTEFERIRMTREPGSSATWNGIDFDSDADNRLAYVDMEYASEGSSIRLSNSRVSIDNVTWAGTNGTILSISSSSVVVRNSVFPSTTAQAVSGHRALGSDPYILFENNVFGVCTGHKQDVLDFSTSGADVMPRFIGNVFLGGGDDALDLDGTSAYVEGNTFMNFHRNFSSLDGESYAVTSGYDAGHSSNHVIVRNLFIDCDNAALVKDRSWIRFEHNTVVRCTGAAINFDEPQEDGIDPGIGAYIDGCIFYETPVPLAHYYVDDATWGTTDIAVHRSMIGVDWHDLGVGNIDCEPTFVDPNDDYHLMPGSGGTGVGAYGLDMGAYVPAGAAVCGEPDPVTYSPEATLMVGGPGIASYKYAVNDPNGPWSEEISVGTPIELAGLMHGQSYRVHVIGKNAAGQWQSEDTAAVSGTWVVDAAYAALRINEVLAHTHESEPDLIELYYDGREPLDLTGMSLTDDPGEPWKFVFSDSSVNDPVVESGGYVVLYGDLETQMPRHLGFALSADGEGLYLFDKPKNGGALLDSVEFGPQIRGYSVGRTGRGGRWGLTKPSFGAANVVAALGDVRDLRINEWFADGRVLLAEDFIEIYNRGKLPVDLSGLYLTDNPITQPKKSALGPLSFIDPDGYCAFMADDSDDPGHLGFRLSPDRELLALFDPNLGEIDKVLYGPQTTDISQGRSPDGAVTYRFFDLPTPGIGNGVSPEVLVERVILVAEAADKRVLIPDSEDAADANWLDDMDFDDTDWVLCSEGPGGIGYERSSGYEDLLSLDVESTMYDGATGCYVRIPFDFEGVDVSELTELVLKVRYDDGFVAYLNGVEIGRRNFTGAPQWDSEADGNHEADGDAFDAYVDMLAFSDKLQAGENLLAIHGLNVSDTSSDFVISVELEGAVEKVVNLDDPYASARAIRDGLRISELMYNAPAGSDYDYVELVNTGDVPLDVNGVRFTEGVAFTFGLDVLAPGERIVVVSDAGAFEDEYGSASRIAGEYTGNFNNGGEQVVLALPVPFEAAIMRFEYSELWYPDTDGRGQSLTIENVYAHPAAWDAKSGWRAAVPTPGN